MFYLNCRHLEHLYFFVCTEHVKQVSILREENVVDIKNKFKRKDKKKMQFLFYIQEESQSKSKPSREIQIKYEWFVDKQQMSFHGTCASYDSLPITVPSYEL